MDTLYKSFDALVYLFTYDEMDDTNRYVSVWNNLYIDTNTGNLISRHFMNTDPFAMREGSVTATDHLITYDDFRKLLSSEKIKDSSRLELLKEDNWEEWLIENKYI